MTASATSEKRGLLPQQAAVFCAVFVLWLLLAGSLDAGEAGAGVLVALLVTLAARPYAAMFAGIRLQAAAPWHLAAYLAAFLVALIKANLDMARMVLSPSLPIRPALVEVKTGLESPLGRLILANSISLTPGTLTVDVNGDRILVHWVDAPPDADLESTTRAIAAHFERHLRGFLA